MDIVPQTSARRATMALRRSARGATAGERMLVLMTVLALYCLLGFGSACVLQ